MTMPHPRIASPHGCYYWLIPVPTNLQGWSSREIPPPRPIWQLCRSQSRMLETDRAHTKCMVICLRKKSNYANFVVFRPLRGSLVLYCTKIPRSPPVATWMSSINTRVRYAGILCHNEDMKIHSVYSYSIYSVVQYIRVTLL